jgi:hypothetical protein
VERRGSTAAVARGSAPAVEEAGAQRGARVRRREGRGPKDLCAKLKVPRDLSVKQNFPLIQRSNEEMPKIRVGGFFKLYNIVLGLKFKSPKLIDLHVKF